MCTWKFSLASAALVLLVSAGVGCQDETRSRSDAELRLSPQEARGRRVYETHCLSCHEPYSRSGRNGPSLAGIFRKPYLPSGIPANDDRVSEIILRGKSMMPGFAHALDERQLQELLLYLKTL